MTKILPHLSFRPLNKVEQLFALDFGKKQFTVTNDPLPLPSAPLKTRHLSSVSILISKSLDLPALSPPSSSNRYSTLVVVGSAKLDTGSWTVCNLHHRNLHCQAYRSFLPHPEGRCVVALPTEADDFFSEENCFTLTRGFVSRSHHTIFSVSKKISILARNQATEVDHASRFCGAGHIALPPIYPTS